MGLRFAHWSALVVVFSLALARVAEAEAPAEMRGEQQPWRGQLVMAKSAQVVLRERPDDNAPPVAFSTFGIRVEVQHSEQDWLNVGAGWLHASDVVPTEQGIEYFNAQLAAHESAFAYLGRACGWLNRKEFDKTLADVSEALRLQPKCARAHYVKGIVAAEQRRSDEEMACYDQAIMLDSRDVVPLAARARLWAACGDYNRAIRDFDAAITLCPSHFWLWAVRGWCHLENADDDKAMADFTTAVELNPRYAFAYACRAGIHFKNQNIEQAMVDAGMAVRLDPKLANGFAIRGQVYAQRGDLDAAIRDFDAAIRLDAGQAKFFVERGNVHHLKRELDAAVNDYTQAISLKGDEADVFFARADVWLQKGDNASALIDLNECLRLDPNSVEALVARGKLRLAASDDEQATNLDQVLQDADAALKLNPRLSRALAVRAEVFRRRRQLDTAIEILSTAIEMDASDPFLYGQRALIHGERGDNELAINDLTEGIRVAPNEAGCLVVRARFLMAEQRWKEAIADLDEAMRRKVPDPMISSFRATCWTNLRQFDKAITDATACIGADPGNLDCLIVRARSLERKGEYEKAIADCQAALRIDPLRKEVLCILAFAYWRARRFDEASKFYTAALTIDPDYPDALAGRAALATSQHKFEMALADIARLMATEKRTRDAYALRAELWMEKQQWQNAMHDLTQAIRLDPSDAHTWSRRAACWIEMGRYRDGLKDANQALRLDPKSEFASVLREKATAGQLRRVLRRPGRARKYRR